MITLYNKNVKFKRQNNHNPNYTNLRIIRIRNHNANDANMRNLANDDANKNHNPNYPNMSEFTNNPNESSKH